MPLLCGGIFEIGFEFKYISPFVGVSNPANIIRHVVFPDPDGPSIVTNSPSSISRFKPLTTNNNTLINWGFFFETNIMNIGALITEVDYDKNVIFQLEYPTEYYTYRVRKSDWDFSINLIKGDTNLDDTVDIVDIIYLVNYILYNNTQNSNLFEKHKLDINTDGFIDILDITRMVNIILD